jgi:hypothetical protein
MLTMHQRARVHRDAAWHETMPVEQVEPAASRELNAAEGICIGTLLALALWFVLVIAALAVWA